LSLAERKHSWAALFGLSAAEATVFPIPPDTLLMPMCLGAPKKAMRLAAICTAGSVIGGIIGYCIGHWLWWNAGEPTAVAQWFYDIVPGFSEKKFEKVTALYDKHDFLIIFVAAFTPIPFKVITITAGGSKISFPMFIVAAIIGRAARFFLVASLLAKYGDKMKVYIDKYFNILCVLFVILLIGGFYLIKVVLHH
jgi:membrane protein YqaA with SNARE-associated domain